MFTFVIRCIVEISVQSVIAELILILNNYSFVIFVDSFGVNTTVQACLCCEAKLQWQLATMIRVSDNIYLLSNGKYLANLTNLRNTFASKRTKRRFVSRIYAVSQNSTSGSNLTLSRVEFRIANIHSSDGKALRRSLIDPDSLRQFSIRIRHSDGHKLTSTPVKLQTVATGTFLFTKLKT